MQKELENAKHMNADLQLRLADMQQQQLQKSEQSEKRIADLQHRLTKLEHELETNKASAAEELRLSKGSKASECVCGRDLYGHDKQAISDSSLVGGEDAMNSAPTDVTID